MKEGQDLKSLAAELDRQRKTKRDFIAPQAAMAMEIDHRANHAAIEGEPVTATKAVPVLTLANNGEGKHVWPLTDHAHGQFAAALGIPKPYYDRMVAEEPALLADNVNTWLRKEPARKRLIRVLDGKARANLSDRFRPLDSWDLFEAGLPALIEAKAEIMSAAITETKIYLKAIFPHLSEPAPEGMVYGVGHGNVVKRNVAAVIIQNSEVGASTLRVEAGFFSTWCTNLAIISDAGMKKYHIGRSAHAELDAAVELFSDETKRLDDAAFWHKVRDVITASCNEEAFRAQMKRVAEIADKKIISDNLPAVVEMTAKAYGFQEGVKNSVLKHLIQGGDLTQYGLLNAVTRASADVESYDMATDLEHVGGKILELNGNEWKRIAEAA